MNWVNCRSSSAWIGLIVALGFVVGCGDSSVVTVNAGGGGANGEDLDLGPEYWAPQGGPEVLPWIRFQEIPAGLDGEVWIDEAMGRIQLGPAAAAAVSDVRVGDVLFGDVHGGFGVHVASVTEVSDGLEVRFETLELINLIHGEWDLEVASTNVSDDDIATVEQGLSPESYTLNTGSLRASGSAGISVSPNFSWRGKIYLNVTGQALVDTHPSVSRSDCGNVLHWSNSAVHSLQLCADYMSFTLDTTVWAEAKANLSAEASFSESGNREIYSRRLGSVSVAGPIALSPQITIGVRASASASAKAELEAVASGQVVIPMGIEWHHNRGVSAVGPSSGSLSFDFEAEADGELEAQAAVTLYAQLTVGLTITGAQNHVGIGDVGAGAQIKAEANYRPLTSPSCLTGDVTLSPYITGKIEAWGRVGPINTSMTIVDDFHYNLTTWTLASWEDGGRFCFGEQERMVQALNEEYSVDCSDPGENQLYGNCLEEMIQHCFAPPASGCQGYVDRDRNIMLVWADGHRVETLRSYEGGLPVDHSTYYNPDGEICVTTEFQGPQGGSCLGNEEYELQMSEVPENTSDMDDEEFQEYLDDQYAAGTLNEEGAKAAVCIDRNNIVLGMYDVTITCPTTTDEYMVSATRACMTGFGQCSFEAVDEFPDVY